MIEYLENFLTNMTGKEFWKSVHICQSYDKNQVSCFFETQCTIPSTFNGKNGELCSTNKKYTRLMFTHSAKMNTARSVY